MIQAMTQFRVRCDTTECGKGTGAKLTEVQAEQDAAVSGWECHAVVGNGEVLHRCPACVRLRRYPEAWPRELRK